MDRRSEQGDQNQSEADCGTSILGIHRVLQSGPALEDAGNVRSFFGGERPRFVAADAHDLDVRLGAQKFGQLVAGVGDGALLTAIRAFGRDRRLSVHGRTEGGNSRSTTLILRNSLFSIHCIT
jgi:hypothetical protein